MAHESWVASHDLDLGHGGAAATSDTSAATTALEAGQDSRRGKGGKAEPQEGGRGLGLAAALGHVDGAVCDFVVAEVVLEKRMLACRQQV